MPNLASLTKAAPIVLICLASAAALLAQALPPEESVPDKADPAKIEHFEKKIRPLLAANCFECHGPEESEAGLRLDSRAAILRGGDSGPAIDLQEVGESLLLKAVRQTTDAIAPMPPDTRLKAEEVAALVAWLKMGAPWPPVKRAVPANAARHDDVPLFSEDEKNFWSFRPVADPPAPAVKNHRWAKSELDRFILATLEEKGLQPAPPAGKRTLIRRATYNLIGLPPDPAEVEDFLANESPDAFARVVERLLSSPHYGERWGRHWLDVARYADSNGMDENLAYSNAFQYRDYVVAAFNKDKPYNQFVREQIAGDLMPVAGDSAATIERQVATGFLAVGPKMLAEDDPTKMRVDIIDEQIDTLGKAFMGLTLGCARCHAHKFDPIPQEDYYSLVGIFQSTKTMEHYRVVASWYERVLGSDEQIAQQKMVKKQIEAQQAKIDQTVREGDERLRRDTRDQVGKYLAADTLSQLTNLRSELASLNDALPKLPAAMGVTEGKIENARVNIRGNHSNLGQEVPRQFPRIIAGENQTPIDDTQSGRLQLANWLASDEHPLTGRVMVNRIWRWHFGTGIVRTPDNFGTTGQRPVNPQLLDWLTARFVESGWSIKAMHRLIMHSATYQMSTAYDEQAAVIDPANRLHWRMNRRRLEAEAIRDALLAVSGSLDLTIGGGQLDFEKGAYVRPGQKNFNDKYYHNTTRRSIYVPVIRSVLYEVFQAFDFPEPATLKGDRGSTTIAPQALFMLNSSMVEKPTRIMAEKLLVRDEVDDVSRIRLIYERAYGRPPSEQESARLLEFLDRYDQALQPHEAHAARRRLAAWHGLCRVIVSASEFIYVD